MGVNTSLLLSHGLVGECRISVWPSTDVIFKSLQNAFFLIYLVYLLVVKLFSRPPKPESKHGSYHQDS